MEEEKLVAKTVNADETNVQPENQVQIKTLQELMGHMNRQQRRKFFYDQKQAEKNKKIKLRRVDNPPTQEENAQKD